jgi:tellurite resistance protein
MTQTASVSTTTRYFEYLPVSLFGSVMGLTGLSGAWRIASSKYGAPAGISELIAVFAALGFVAMLLCYGAKCVTSPEAVRAEFAHPIAVNTFATFWVSMLLLPIVLSNYNLPAARLLWAIGAVGILVFSWYIVGRWLRGQYQLSQAAPAWILPVVGLLDLPLAVPSLALPHGDEVTMVGLAIGLFFAVPIFTMVFLRLVFEPPLPPPLEPSVFILVGPFAVGTSAYLATTGQMDMFAKSLYLITLFILAVMLGRLRHLGRCCPFKVGWWAVSFPLAASATAAIKVAYAQPGWATDAIAVAALALATIVIAWLFGRTLVGIARGELRTLSV